MLIRLGRLLLVGAIAVVFVNGLWTIVGGTGSAAPPVAPRDSMHPQAVAAETAVALFLEADSREALAASLGSLVGKGSVESLAPAIHKSNPDDAPALLVRALGVRPVGRGSAIAQVQVVRVGGAVERWSALVAVNDDGVWLPAGAPSRAPLPRPAPTPDVGRELDRPTAEAVSGNLVRALTAYHRGRSDDLGVVSLAGAELPVPPPPPVPPRVELVDVVRIDADVGADLLLRTTSRLASPGRTVEVVNLVRVRFDRRWLVVAIDRPDAAVQSTQPQERQY